MKPVRLLTIFLIIAALALFDSAVMLDHTGSVTAIQSLVEIISLIALFDILSGLSLFIVRALRHKPTS
jgi:hypothetical protein